MPLIQVNCINGNPFYYFQFAFLYNGEQVLDGRHREIAMQNFETKNLESDGTADSRPVWQTPEMTVAEVNTLTRTAGFTTFDAPTSFGS